MLESFDQKDPYKHLRDGKKIGKTPEEFTCDMEGVKSFSELYKVIAEIQKVDKDFCPPDMFQYIYHLEPGVIEEMVSREMTYKPITRKYGLRSKVKELVSKLPPKSLPPPVLAENDMELTIVRQSEVEEERKRDKRNDDKLWA